MLGKRIDFEFIVFLVVAAANTWPVLVGNYFPSLDGPAHLYNSNLINELLFQNNQVLDDYFIFNSIPVPNWTGHIVLSTFNLFIPAYLAEKLLLLFYVLGLPLAFRQLVVLAAPQNTFLSFLIFPFIYSHFLFLGFYNFLLAIIFMLLTIRYWIVYENEIFKWKRACCFFLLLLLAYFSHLFVFMLLLVFIGGYILFKGLIQAVSSSNGIKKILIVVSRKMALLLGFASLFIIGAIHYFMVLPSLPNEVFLSYTELTEALINVRPVIALNAFEEEPHTKKLFYVLFALLVIALFKKMKGADFSGDSLKKRSVNIFRSLMTPSDAWLFFSLGLLFLYFTKADSDGAYGYVSHRLGLIFFICISLWLALQPFPKWLGLTVTVVVLYGHFKRNQYYSSVVERLNGTVQEFNQAAEKIEPNAVVFPIDYSGNWMQLHFANYLGIEKPMVILENYETVIGWFPLKWDTENLPANVLGDWDLDQSDCFYWKLRGETNNSTKNIDYVFIQREELAPADDTCYKLVKSELNRHYRLVSSAPTCSLYQLIK